MKGKIYFTLLSLILITAFSGSFVVSEKLDFTTEVTQISENRIDIEVTILSGEPEFIYSLWENEPWENGKEIENSGTITSASYTFRNLDKKPYFVVVTDKNGLRRVKQVEIITVMNLSAGQPGY